MKYSRNTKIGIFILLSLFISILFYTQYFALNSNNLSLSTSAKVSNQSQSPTCAPPPLRCPKGSTCNNQSKTCQTSLSPPITSPSTAVVPTGTSLLPTISSIPVCTGQLGDEWCKPILSNPKGGSINCHANLYPLPDNYFKTYEVLCVKKEYLKFREDNPMPSLHIYFDFNSRNNSIYLNSSWWWFAMSMNPNTIISVTLDNPSLKQMSGSGDYNFAITPNLPDIITGRIRLWMFSSANDAENAGNNPLSPPYLEAPFSFTLYKKINNNRFFLTETADRFCRGDRSESSYSGSLLRLQDKYYLTGHSGNYFSNDPSYFYCSDLYGELERNIALEKLAPYDKVCANISGKTVWISKDQCMQCDPIQPVVDSFSNTSCAKYAGPITHCDISSEGKTQFYCGQNMRCKAEPGSRSGICVLSLIP